jgi:glycosyltransferase involved in cell wall biosynthesis
VNILYDHQVFSWQRYGGISRYFYEIISRLCKVSSISTSVFLGFHINEYGLSSFRDHYKYYWGVKRPLLPKTTKLVTFANNVLFSLIAPTFSTDIYHQTYYTCLMPSFPGKRIVTVHDMIHEIYPEYFPSDRSFTTSKRDSIARAEGIICPSRNTKDDLLRYYNVPEHKIRIIAHGNSLNFIVTSPRIIPEPYILFTGQRTGYKNFTLLLTAYAKSMRLVADYKLVCFGGERFSKEERKRISSLGLMERVIHQSGSDEILANLYTYAAVFVYPSLYEGFGIPLLEAMHYQCPVLAGNTSSIPEVVGDGGMYFDPKDEDALSAAMEQILSDSSLRDDLIQRGVAREKQYSWDACAKETLDFYSLL